MIKVWTDGIESGLLDRTGDRGSTFLYLPETIDARAVSVTMPVRLSSWNVRFGLAPIFEMNLPEGVLRERLRLTFAKATGTFDDFDLLAIVGRSQVGRIRYTAQKEKLEEDVPFQSIDEILGRRRSGDLFRYLIERFASFSGISGVQPNRETLGTERISATGSERVFLPEGCREMRAGCAPLSARRGCGGAGDRPFRPSP